MPVVVSSEDRWVSNHRRYCFLAMKRGQRLRDDSDLQWDGKRREIPGTTIPVGFPARAEILLAGYLVTEELDGANIKELLAAGLSRSQAAAVIAALGEL